jgi:hypothetical protein
VKRDTATSLALVWNIEISGTQAEIFAMMLAPAALATLGLLLTTNFPASRTAIPLLATVQFSRCCRALPRCGVLSLPHHGSQLVTPTSMHNFSPGSGFI